jgi:hypothetical protein
MHSLPPSFVARSANPSLIRRAVDRRGLAVFAASICAALLLAGVMLFAIWARTRVTSAGYALDKAVREHQALLREREGLTVQAAYQRSPGRLMALAKKLGMGPAPADRTVVLVEGAPRARALLAAPLVARRP